MMGNIPRGMSVQQHAILQHIERYEYTEPRVLRLRVEPGATRMKITKCMSRLCRRQLAERYQLDGSQVYYRLGPAAQGIFDVSNRLIGSMGPQSFEIARAVLHYCCLGPRSIERLKPSELAAAFPSLPDSELLQPYYVDPRGFLGLFRLADPKRPSYRIVRSIREAIEKRLAIGEPFANLMAREKFLIVLMTYTDAQRASLKTVIESSKVGEIRKDWPAIPIRVHAIPG